MVAELTIVPAVKAVKLAPSQPAPLITREVVQDKERVLGQYQYETALVPAGSVVRVRLVVDGLVVAELGPWTAVPQAGCNALAQVRLAVSDSCQLATLEPQAVE